MRFNFFVLITLIVCRVSFSQVVVSFPQYATENDSIKIIFDASQGGGGMMNYTGTVYTHTGVNTNLGNWQHVIGSWGNNTTQPALTRLGPNLYELVIGLPRQFYNITNANEHITALAFVFRSANSQQQTEDIFLQIYEPGLNVIVNNPQVQVEFGDPLRSPAFANQDDTVDISITAVEIGTKVSSLKLYVNTTLAAQTNQNTLNFDFIGSDYTIGAHNITAVGTDTSGNSDTSKFIMFVNPQVTLAPMPAGVKPGINYVNDHTVTFVLFAPYKEFVYLIGSFNDWKVGINYLFKKHEVNADSTFWWMTIDYFTPGNEYIFQYLVDGNIRIGDPYTDKISDPDDQYILNTTYPNLIDYPFGKTNYPASVLQTAQQSYQWQTANFQKPKKTDLVVYELLIRDFLATHDYKTLHDTLNYLKNLGVNAIELMPVNEFEGNESWGYNPSFYFATDKYYGPKNDLKKFIDKAHSMGMAVIMDIVLNHSYGQSPLVRLYWDAVNQRPAPNNPWFNVVSPNNVYYWGYDFNHESQATKDFVDRVNKYWLTEYKFDGFRFDFTKGFTNTPGNGQAYDQSRINILKRMADRIWETDSEAYVILEHLTDNSEETVLSNYGMMLWGKMNYEYNEATMGYPSDLTWGSYKARGWTFPHLVTYMESHDEERLMYKNLQYGASSGNYNIKNLNTALNRIQLAAAFFFTIPGPKMIWQFGELGYDISIEYPCHLCNKPILWNYFSVENRRKLYKVFVALIDLKVNYDAFESGGFSLDVDSTFKKINIYHSQMYVTVIGNFGITAGEIVPAFGKTGMWYDFFSGDSMEVTNTAAPITLQPGEFHIYTTVKLPTPEPGLLTDAEMVDDAVPQKFTLEQNYPNPFNPATLIRYSIPQGGTKVNLTVYDILGNEIITLVDQEQSPGNYEVEFDGSNLSSGVYLYQLRAGGHISTKKLILLK